MDNKRTLFDFNDRILVGTMKITVPNKMAFITKQGKLKEVPTLTKSGIPSMRNKKRTIKLVEHNFDNAIISNSGYSTNDINDFKEYKKLEKQYNELFDKKEETNKEWENKKYAMGNRKTTKQNLEIRNKYNKEQKQIQKKLDEIGELKNILFKKMYGKGKISPYQKLEDFV